MAFSVASRVKETTTTTGTGTINLAGAESGYQTFVAGIGDGNVTYYCIESGTAWEVGLGTVTDATPDTLSRTTILASSNSGSAITLSGTSTVFCTQPGEHAVVANPYDSLTYSNDGDTLVAGRKYLVDTSGGTTALTFPTAAIGNHGQAITVRKTTTDANTVTLTVSGVTVKLWAQGDFVECVSVASGGGYAWKVFSHYFAPHVATMYRDSRWPASGNVSTSYPGTLVEWTHNESFNLGPTTDITTDHDITITRAGTYEVSYNGYSYDGGNSNWHIGNIEHTPSGGSADYSCSTSNYSQSQNSRSLMCSQVYEAGVGDTFALYHWGSACHLYWYTGRGRIYYSHLTVREVR
tara:strand:- start:1301 stop:2353 length:1053 start_codon:yes stop_codon:yes gene_type:complete